MSTVYHFTEKKNLPSIFEQGLIPCSRSPFDGWSEIEYGSDSFFVVTDMSNIIMNGVLSVLINKHVWYEDQLEEWSQDDWDNWLDSYTCLVIDLPDNVELHNDLNRTIVSCSKKIHQTICPSLITSQLPCKFNWNN